MQNIKYIVPNKISVVSPNSQKSLLYKNQNFEIAARFIESKNMKKRVTLKFYQHTRKFFS